MAGKGGYREGAGRPKGKVPALQKEIKELCIPHAEDAVKVLIGIMKGKSKDSDKIAAAKEILDRAFGKAKQHVEANLGVTLLDIINGTGDDVVNSEGE